MFIGVSFSGHILKLICRAQGIHRGGVEENIAQWGTVMRMFGQSTIGEIEVVGGTDQEYSFAERALAGYQLERWKCKIRS